MIFKKSYIFPVIIILGFVYLMGNMFYTEIMLDEPASIPEWLPPTFLEASKKWASQDIYDMVGQIYMVQLILLGLLILYLERIK
jgi:hypothetical protein